MNTKFETKKEYEDVIFQLTDSSDCTGSVRPSGFMRKMWENRGEAAAFSAFPLPDDGLERKNPLIVVLGDSVTVGHFEFIMDPEENQRKREAGILSPDELLEVVDVRESYPDRFRSKLIEKYGTTSVSVINSGIAGDTVLGMAKRLDRDVLRYQPDLIIINATLNWMPDCGPNDVYRDTLCGIVERCRKETTADIILLTPNEGLHTPFDNPLSTLEDRVNIVRETAEKYDTCLVDVYKIWKAYENKGYPATGLLANGVNHPSKTGHEVYARALMKLFD